MNTRKSHCLLVPCFYQNRLSFRITETIHLSAPVLTFYRLGPCAVRAFFRVIQQITEHLLCASITPLGKLGCDG